MSPSTRRFAPPRIAATNRRPEGRAPRAQPRARQALPSPQEVPPRVPPGADQRSPERERQPEGHHQEGGTGQGGGTIGKEYPGGGTAGVQLHTPSHAIWIWTCQDTHGAR